MSLHQVDLSGSLQAGDIAKQRHQRDDRPSVEPFDEMVDVIPSADWSLAYKSVLEKIGAGYSDIDYSNAGMPDFFI